MLSILVCEYGRNVLRHPYGVARDVNGMVCTIDAVNQYEHYICIFDPRNTAHIVERLPYQCIGPHRKDKSKVRFLDIFKDRLVVADLGEFSFLYF